MIHNKKNSISSLTQNENLNALHQSLNDIKSEVFAQKQKILLSPHRRKEQKVLRLMLQDKELYNKDSTELLKNTNIEIKRAQLSLNHLVRGQDQMSVLNEKKQLEIEVIPEFPTFVKVPLSGYIPPCIINVKAMTMNGKPH